MGSAAVTWFKDKLQQQIKDAVKTSSIRQELSKPKSIKVKDGSF